VPKRKENADKNSLHPGPALVRAFFDASVEALRFLDSEPGFHLATTVEELMDDEVETIEPEAVAGLFWAKASFETDRLLGEVTYGDREAYINLVVSPRPPLPGAADGYALWEWVAAFGGADPRARGDALVVRTDRVREVVRNLGAVLRDYAGRITTAGRPVIDRLEAGRAERQREWEEQLAKWEAEGVTARAAKAFRARDYRQVVELLESLGPRLSPAARKKLEYARKHL
jgi:hypothetical protein